MVTQIHHELIGSVPTMEEYRNQIPERIVVWEQAYGQDRMINGMLLELIAQHFYGLQSSDFGSVNDLVEALKEIDK